MRTFWKKPQRIKAPEITGTLKVSNEKPPVWDDVCVAFGIKPEAYFTYGDTIYNPSNLPLLPDIVEHERVHMEQQLAFIPPERRIKGNENEGAALWWGKYLRDPAFRVDQESRAYGRQYEVICSVVKDRNQRHRYLMALARSLSGPLYNNSIGQVEAMQLIKSFAKIKP
jgi:hypothetical protein